MPFPHYLHSLLQFLTWNRGNVPWGAGSSYKDAGIVCRLLQCLLPETPQARGAHLGCCVWLWGSLFWAVRRSCRGSAGLTGWALGGEAEGPGLLELILQLLQGWFQTITESARLEQAMEIIKSNLCPDTALSALGVLQDEQPQIRSAGKAGASWSSSSSR